MSTHNKYRQDMEDSQADLNSKGSQAKHKKLVALTADFYTEWSTEKTSIENPKSGSLKNSAELLTGKEYLRQNIKHKYNRMNGNVDADIATCYNEIYNRPDLFIFS